MMGCFIIGFFPWLSSLQRAQDYVFIPQRLKNGFYTQEKAVTKPIHLIPQVRQGSSPSLVRICRFRIAHLDPGCPSASAGSLGPILTNQIRISEVGHNVGMK